MTTQPSQRPSKPKHLCNQHDRATLQRFLDDETSPRTTYSFYRYQEVKDPESLRDAMYLAWKELRVLGRVYLAQEGINGQVSVPAERNELFRKSLNGFFPKISTRKALNEENSSFFKLTIKTKNKIVADGLDVDIFHLASPGKHLSAEAFNQALAEEDTVVVDVRNHYESAVGHFAGALLPDVDTFRQQLPEIDKMLKPHKESKILLYCTGGIRCEKASAWLKYKGFQDVNQLAGGIIGYTQQVRSQGLTNKFIGKNFVFDHRLGERVTTDVIGRCAICDAPADEHRNCAWTGCHRLHIACAACFEKLKGFCSSSCRENNSLPKEQQRLRIKKSQGPYRKGR